MWLGNSAAGRTVPRTLTIINAVENIQRGDVSTQSLKSSVLQIIVSQTIKLLYVVCNRMGQADTGVYQPRDENSTPYEV